MKSLLGYTAFGGALSLGLANAKALKWSPDSDQERRWEPPHPTLGFMPALGMNDLTGAPHTTVPAPAPTTPPVLPPRALDRRASTDNTCGYIDGIRTNSLWCPTSQFCAYNSINSHIGCCDDSSTDGCNVWTTCLRSDEARKFSTDNGLTLWCGFSDYPNCLTHLYVDATATGYTLLGCGVAAGTDEIYITAFDDATSSESSSSESDTSTTTTESSTSSTRTGVFNPGSTQPPRASESSPTPIGAIVGGAVGGVAALALIGLVIFFLVRQNNKRKENVQPATGISAVPPPSGPGAGGGQQQQQLPQQPPASPTNTQMGQHGGYYDPSAAGFAHLDPRASIAKPPAAYNGYGDQQGPPTISPPASPAPAPLYNNTPSPPPQQQQQPGGYFPQQQPPQQPGVYSPEGQYSPQAAYAQALQQQQQQQQQQQPGLGQYSPQQQQQPGLAGQYSPQQQHQQPGPGQYSPQPQPQYGQPQQRAYQAYQPQRTYAAELPTERGDGEVRELAG